MAQSAQARWYESDIEGWSFQTALLLPHGTQVTSPSGTPARVRPAASGRRVQDR